MNCISKVLQRKKNLKYGKCSQSSGNWSFSNFPRSSPRLLCKAKRVLHIFIRNVSTQKHYDLTVAAPATVQTRLHSKAICPEAVQSSEPGNMPPSPCSTVQDCRTRQRIAKTEVTSQASESLSSVLQPPVSYWVWAHYLHFCLVALGSRRGAWLVCCSKKCTLSQHELSDLWKKDEYGRVLRVARQGCLPTSTGRRMGKAGCWVQRSTEYTGASGLSTQGVSPGAQGEGRVLGLEEYWAHRVMRRLNMLEGISPGAQEEVMGIERYQG